MMSTTATMMMKVRHIDTTAGSKLVVDTAVLPC
jgi:hypothetical protein